MPRHRAARREPCDCLGCRQPSSGSHAAQMGVHQRIARLDPPPRAVLIVVERALCSAAQDGPGRLSTDLVDCRHLDVVAARGCTGRLALRPGAASMLQEILAVPPDPVAAAAGAVGPSSRQLADRSARPLALRGHPTAALPFCRQCLPCRRRLLPHACMPWACIPFSHRGLHHLSPLQPLPMPTLPHACASLPLLPQVPGPPSRPVGRLPRSCRHRRGGRLPASRHPAVMASACCCSPTDLQPTGWVR